MADKPDTPDTEWLDRVYDAGGDPATLRRAYDDWATRYDDDVASYGYTHPQFIAAMLCRHVAPGSGAILDAGVGTGLLGAFLAPLGYTDLQGIDLSEGMLAVAARRGVYARLQAMTLGERLDFADGRFAAVVCAGVLTMGHAPPGCLEDLVRVTRPGGHLVFSISELALADGGYAAAIEALERAGRWSAVDHTGAYRSMPHAGADHQVPCRTYVYRAA